MREGEDFNIDPYKYPMLRSAMNASVNYYSNPTESGTRQHGGGGKSFAYVRNTGKASPTNQNNYNTTNNYSVFNQKKTYNTTTNNYDYEYNWYNPITNTYNTTNNFKYNAEYNTYNYVTNNNYYTTNYFIQDNRTYVSYYIIQTNKETQEEEETYIEHYYELPDGRNSLDLTADQVKGQYFISNYSKYISVAEDDGTTLGLWHLDGDLKDYSFHNNSAGSAYNNVYTDGLYSKAKRFSENEQDFLMLRLDKVDLPSSWTLEWCELVPSVSVTESVLGVQQEKYPFALNAGDRYFPDSKYDLKYNIYLNGYLGVDGLGYIEPSVENFVPYAVTCDEGNYKFYRNGVLVDEYDFSDKPVTRKYPRNFTDSEVFIDSKKITIPKFSTPLTGLSVDSDSIRFYCATKLVESIKGNEYILGLGTSGDGCYSYPVYNYYSTSHRNAIVDEVRLSKGVLYNGDFYTPPVQAYTTNTVLVVPDDPEKHEIAFKTNTNISDVRFGGARPTYPLNGSVYVAIDNEQKVESIQQYQEDGWYEIEASVYLDDGWEALKGFNMDYFTIGGSSGSSSGGDSGGGSGGDSGSDSGNIIQSILDALGKFGKIILTFVNAAIEGIVAALSSILSLFTGISEFTVGFSGFLTSAFGFLPAEAVAVIIAGISLIVILAILKFLRG